MLRLVLPTLRHALRSSSTTTLSSVAAQARALHASPPAAATGSAKLGQAVTELLTVPAYKGLAVPLKAGQLIKVINTHGHQVCDFWAFGTGNVGKDGLLRSYMSMHHSRDHIRSHIPAPGDTFVTAQFKPIITFLEDSGPGAHDSSAAACSHEIYELVLGIGPDDPHDSCTNNLHTSLARLGYKLTDDVKNFYTPGPFNLWMNVPLREKRAPTFDDWWAGPHPDQKPGDYVVMRAEMDCVAVMSACPASDISPLNGPTGKSHDVHCQVFAAPKSS